MADSFGVADRRYITDDRDSEQRTELVIGMGGNGDWYVAVVPEGEGAGGRSVRICTSGGAAREAPGLPNAIAAAYRAMVGEHPRSEERLPPEIWRMRAALQRIADEHSRLPLDASPSMLRLHADRLATIAIQALAIERGGTEL